MILLIAIILGSIFLDQLTKWLAVIYLEAVSTVPLWQDVLHLTYVQNEGAAFGIFSNQRWIFMVFSTLAIVGLSIYLFRFSPKNAWIRIPIAMIIGGGIGNMIDRILLGYVIDFIDFRLINFAVFNVADSFVTVGAFMIMGYLIVDIIRETKAEKQKKSTDSKVPSDETGDSHHEADVD